ncbi:MAG: SAM-dependent methyltransferase, partial [Bacteroidales bacterium]|nr:SAM-dependent methyltransferase [Bacteroidales bacterium]
MDEATLAFAREHVGDDVNRLLLSGCDGVDARAAARQIEGLRTAQTKWPSLAACANVEYPPRLNCEQSSSEATARYKAAIAARLMQGGGVAATVADLTGGMGIDSWAMAAVAERVHYVELDAALCDLARRNFAALGVRNISTHCADGIAWLGAQNEQFGLIYIDPSRRDVSGRRTVALEHCRPDVLQAWPLLTSRAGRVMVKAAPMIDLAAATAQLGDVAEVHVVAVGGECKEVLMVSGQAPEPVVT